MPKRKRTVYVVASVAFLALWLAMFGWVLTQSNNTAEAALEDWARATQEQIEGNIGGHVAALDTALTAAGAHSATSRQQLLGALLALQLEEGLTPYILDGEGRTFDAAGLPTGRRAEPGFLQKLARDGLALTGWLNAGSGVQEVAVCYRAAGSEDTYLAVSQPMEQFFDMALRDVPMAGEHTGIFSEWGSLFHYATGGISREDGQSLQEAAVHFSRSMDTVSVEKASGLWQYNVLVSLQAPPDYFLGFSIPAERVVPLSPSILIIMVVLLVLWAGLMVLIILTDPGRKGTAQQENAVLQEVLMSEVEMRAALLEVVHKHPAGSHCFIGVDVAAFHRFNVMHGYAMGDRLLRAMMKVLRERYPTSIHTGGDVFGVLTLATNEAAERLQASLFEGVQRELGRQYLQVVEFKFGVYPVLGTGQSFREIYDGAMLALRDAKKQPKKAVVVYDEVFHRRASFEKSVEMNMLRALSREEFLVYVQPKMDVATRRCCGGEALVRWQSEQLGMVMPDQFIPLFEHNGFVVEIDFFVLEKALAYLQDLLRYSGRAYPIAVNQSKITLTYPNYIERLTALVARYDVPLHYVEIEITESALESNYDLVLETMVSLKEMGFQLSMDDFGTGYSSLNVLRVLPVDTLKIDKGFLKESDVSSRTRKIVESVVGMARSLGIGVVCEGVETEVELEFLRSIGCDRIQGYLFARPMPYSDYERDYLRPLMPNTTHFPGSALRRGEEASS